MDSVDLSVLKAVRDWRAGGHRVWLATVVRTFGSSPRPPGAMLALREDGVAVGSVSGGCIEDDLIGKAREGRLPEHRAEGVTYGVTQEEAMRFGLPCGGTLQLVVEPVQDAYWVGDVLHRVERHQITARQLNLANLSVDLMPAGPDAALVFDGEMLTTVHGPRWRLLIIGASQTSSYLARMALALDYEVIVCDPREEYTSVWDVADTRIVKGMPDDVVLELQVDVRTAVVALTHDPKLDDMALLEALKSPAFYVGALGSQRNNEKRRERLALFDLSAQEIARLHGPVGLDIGSRTPPEIAVAILAHLVQERARLARSAARDTELNAGEAACVTPKQTF
ncbi:xanthine dehydrogenase accessory factor [Novimethylophilus kurashikiensis]|uniref:Xanthine dehydrogenase accessory factor n=1 Tax=Novimethylophilus kurashikiensis TaxID=1825523 RepID=A0A2R5FIH3_9PROT|nr:XdhC family protein [Novimethylophilus kurashikiensis]GBG15761.1 xanthine dehydrogenase accessory factor [Novimethylophilus kurashikiensis]